MHTALLLMLTLSPAEDSIVETHLVTDQPQELILARRRACGAVSGALSNGKDLCEIPSLL